MYAEVIPDVAIKKRLDYAIPTELESLVVPGVYVEVPIRGRRVAGYVVAVKETCAVASPSLIAKMVSDGPVLTADLFQLALWMSSYYATSIGKTIRTMLPAGVRKGVRGKRQCFVMRAVSRDEMVEQTVALREKAPSQANVLTVMLKAKKGMLLTDLLEQALCQASAVEALVEKGFLSTQLVRCDRSLLTGEEYFYTSPKNLRDEQQVAVESIQRSLGKGEFAVKLLHGVTGSGKTEVYMQAIQTALDMGKGVLMLVPEISLTAQTTQRFKGRFREKIAIIHHRLSDGDRQETWSLIAKGACSIVIGARSAVFSPIHNLGLIIIDEEHEHSYKHNDDSPSYHARDIGVVRGKITNATVVLGSATPSVESYHNAVVGKYELLTLKARPSSATLPVVHIVDMKKEYDKAKGITYFSDMLLQKIDEKTKRGEQVMLFLNRRGYHTTLTCKQCSKVVICAHCECAMTFHRAANRLACHLCGFEQDPPLLCPSCKVPSMMKFTGVGTEKVEAMLHGIFPHLRSLRADADSTRHKGSLEKILTDFRTGKADILIGTQMIAKGLHFPEVTLVGILNCDASLHIPDFRAQESVFQLIMQVAGRAGRGLSPGEVILQTSLPENETIQKASKQDYAAFFDTEVALRKLFLFPPYTHIVKFVFQGEDARQVEAVATQHANHFQKLLSSQFSCHPALPCGHAKIQDKWRFQVLVRGPSVTAVTALIEQIDKSAPISSGVQRFCDVNPTSTFF